MAEGHYTDGFKEDEHGWWSGSCVCGFALAGHPGIDTLVDGFMDHAFSAGAASVGAVPQEDETL